MDKKTRINEEKTYYLIRKDEKKGHNEQLQNNNLFTKMWNILSAQKSE